MKEMFVQLSPLLAGSDLIKNGLKKRCFLASFLFVEALISKQCEVYCFGQFFYFIYPMLFQSIITSDITTFYKRRVSVIYYDLLTDFQLTDF